MLFGKDGFRKKNNGKILIGYELTPDTAQISFMRIGDNQPYTFSTIAGKEEYDLPLSLYLRREDNLWLLGKDTLGKEGISPQDLVEELLKKAWQNQSLELYGQSYSYRALLALFIKKSLSLLSMEINLNQLAGIMFTVDSLDAHKIEALREMARYLGLTGVEILFMGKEESFFWYNLHTEQSLWKGEVMLYELEKTGLIRYRLFVNRNTTPLVTLVEKKEYPEWRSLTFDRVSAESRDEAFLSLCKQDFGNRNVTAVYLIGDGFDQDCYQESLRYLCQNRRVFRGNNLYSKGACQGLLQKLDPDKLGEAYVYLGEDKLLANVGMNLLRQGEESYLAVLNGGNSWYDCKKEWDIILEGSNQLIFRIIPLNGKTIREYTMELNGLAGMKKVYSRIHLSAWMNSPTQLQVRACDLGFGQFYPSTNRIWEETIEL